METVEDLKKEVLRLKQELADAVETINWHEERAYVYSQNSDAYEKAYKEKRAQMRFMQTLLDKANAEIRELKGEDPGVLTD
jgi:hypothetical protein